MTRSVLALAVALIMPLAARAQEVTVIQQGRKFSAAEVTVPQGSSVRFANQDPYTHNVFSKTPGMAFDLRTQHSGAWSDVRFDQAGTADVQCAIHPQMRMTVKVIPKP